MPSRTGKAVSGGKLRMQMTIPALRTSRKTMTSLIPPRTYGTRCFCGARVSAANQPKPMKITRMKDSGCSIQAFRGAARVTRYPSG